jgi:hypothetical protein
MWAHEAEPQRRRLEDVIQGRNNTIREAAQRAASGRDGVGPRWHREAEVDLVGEHREVRHRGDRVGAPVVLFVGNDQPLHALAGPGSLAPMSCSGRPDRRRGQTGGRA